MALNVKRKIKKDKSRNVVFTVYFILFILSSFLCLYPLFWTFINSVKTSSEFYRNPHGFPDVWRFDLYPQIFSSFKVGAIGFWEMAWNSVWLSFGGQALNIFASMCVAYPLARYKFPLKNFFYFLIIFRITIPIVGSGAAGYKFIRAIGGVNNPSVYMLTYINGFDLSALVMYGYFKAISKDYSDAAFIDGASTLQMFFKIIVPQAMPCIIALYVNSVMGYWNVYTTSQIYLTDYPNLALGIFELSRGSSFLGANGTAKYYGAILLSSLVPLLLFAFSQNTMLKNISVGGLKG